MCWFLSFVEIEKNWREKSDDGKIYLKSTVLRLVTGLKHVQYFIFKFLDLWEKNLRQNWINYATVILN